MGSEGDGKASQGMAKSARTTIVEFPQDPFCAKLADRSWCRLLRRSKCSYGRWKASSYPSSKVGRRCGERRRLSNT
eukprot:scaffold1726_cov260-Pinguiococcus_pyrenoidosus.AAC.13